MRIGIVEDDLGVASALAEALRVQRIDSVHFARGSDLLLQHAGLDAVILDLGLPDLDGVEVLRRLRRLSAVPVLVLTARDDDRSTILALRSGADDYLVKPARMFVLLARLEAVTRRTLLAKATTGASTETHGALTIDRAARRVTRGDEAVPLTTKEFELLTVLLDARGAAVSREHLLDRVWGDAYMAASRSLDVHINALRTKLGEAATITTMRGFGYHLGE
ncbi:response regulator transcription factor [Micrococcales bacterium 31B]|nr:response regulator transcription factor [Micrococcales bacterium 31B]